MTLAIIHSSSNRGDFAKKTVLDTQLDKLIMHSIKRSKKASERAKNGGLGGRGRRRTCAKKENKKKLSKGSEVGFFRTSFAVENRVIRGS